VTEWHLDACSLMNLYASRRLERIAAELGVVFRVMPWVLEHESIYVYGREGLERTAPVLIDMSTSIAQGHVVVAGELATNAERDLLVELSARGLDRGEAETMAAVVIRQGGIVTDERKALKVLGQVSPSTAYKTTIGLMREWAEKANPNADELRESLWDIRVGGNFIPSPRDPDYEWWVAASGKPDP